MALYVITDSTSDTRICCTSFMTITAEERLAQTTRGNFAECSMLFSGLRGKVGRKLLLFVMTRNTPRTTEYGSLAKTLASDSCAIDSSERNSNDSK